MAIAHMTARGVLENRIKELTNSKRHYEERAAQLKIEMDGQLERAHENDQEIRILKDSLAAMESLV